MSVAEVTMPRSIAFDDRAVYARGQAKIIRINNETAHWVSLTKTVNHKEHEGTPMEETIQLDFSRSFQAEVKIRCGNVEKSVQI